MESEVPAEISWIRYHLDREMNLFRIFVFKHDWNHCS